MMDDQPATDTPSPPPAAPVLAPSAGAPAPFPYITDGKPWESSDSGASLGYDTETEAPVAQAFGAQSVFGGGSALGLPYRYMQRENATDNAVDWGQSKIPAEQVNKNYGPIGPDGKQVKLTDEPMYPETARVLAQQVGDRLDREGIISRFQDQHGVLTNLGVSFAASLSDPLQAASLFVPGIGEEGAFAVAGKLGLTNIGMSGVTRTAVRAIEGATGAAAGQIPLTAMQYGLGKTEDSDYGLREAFKDLVFNAGVGAVLHSGFGGVFGDAKKLNKYTSPETELPQEPPAGGATAGSWGGNIRPDISAEAAKIMDAPAPTTHAAISTSVAQMAEGREVSVDPFFPKPGEEQTLADLAQKQQEIYKEGFQPGMTSGQLKAATDDILGSNEAEKLEGQKPSAQERPEAAPAQAEAASEQESVASAPVKSPPTEEKFTKDIVNDENVKKTRNEEYESWKGVYSDYEEKLDNEEQSEANSEALRRVGGEDKAYDADGEITDAYYEALNDAEREMLKEKREAYGSKTAAEKVPEIETLDDALKSAPKHVADKIEQVIKDSGLKYSRSKSRKGESHYFKIETPFTDAEGEEHESAKIRVSNHYREGSWETPEHALQPGEVGGTYHSEADFNIQPGGKDLGRLLDFIKNNGNAAKAKPITPTAERNAGEPDAGRGRAGVAGGSGSAEGTAGAARAGVKPSPLDQEISALEAKIDTSKYTAEELAALHDADQKIREAELWKKGYQALADCLKGV